MSSENEILSRDETKLAIQEELINVIKTKIGESSRIHFIPKDQRKSDDEILEQYPQIYVIRVCFSKKMSKPKVKIDLDSRVIYLNSGLTTSTKNYLENWGVSAATIVKKHFERENIILRKIQFFLLPDNLRVEFKIPNILLENLVLIDEYTNQKIGVNEYLAQKMIDESDDLAVAEFNTRRG